VIFAYEYLDCFEPVEKGPVILKVGCGGPVDLETVGRRSRSERRYSVADDFDGVKITNTRGRTLQVLVEPACQTTSDSDLCRARLAQRSPRALMADGDSCRTVVRFSRPSSLSDGNRPPR
jgi:hypothetical protein